MVDIGFHNAVEVSFNECRTYQDSNSGEWWSTTDLYIKSKTDERIRITLYSPRADKEENVIRFCYEQEAVHKLAQENLELKAKIAMIEEMVKHDTN
jgi:hypothetical protein